MVTLYESTLFSEIPALSLGVGPDRAVQVMGILGHDTAV